MVGTKYTDHSEEQMMKDPKTVNLLRTECQKIEQFCDTSHSNVSEIIYLEDIQHFPNRDGIEQLEALLLWYQRKGRIVEGFTLLSELCIERVIEANKPDLYAMIGDFKAKNPENYLLKDKRHFLYTTINTAFKDKIRKKRNPDYLNPQELIPGLSAKIVDYVIAHEHNLLELAQISKAIDKNRDDINHAGLVDDPKDTASLAFHFDRLVNVYFDLNKEL
jgi:hypothetical protein